MNNKPYPRSSVMREPSPAAKRMLDTNVLIDALYEDESRFAQIDPWFLRLTRRAPKGRILIPDAVLDEFMHVTQNSPLLDGKEKVSAENAIRALNTVLRRPSVRVVPNASPTPSSPGVTPQPP